MDASTVPIDYRAAELADLDFLVASRLDFVHADATDPAHAPLEANIRAYFAQVLAEKQCDVLLAESDGAVIGTGIVFYYRSVPSIFNPSGRNAYITSMYVRADYRRRGIGTDILDRLVHLARGKGFFLFFLQASDMGAPLYHKYGFRAGEAGMVLQCMPE